MEIFFYGGGCVLIATKSLKLLLDPPQQLKSVKADVTLLTNSEAKFATQGFVIDTAGEYEIRGVVIMGIAAQLHIDTPKDPKRGTMYLVEFNNLKLLATGNIDSKLSDEQVEAIGEINALVLPVGGHGLTLDGTAAAQLVSQFEPQYVVPVHYDDGKTKYDVPQDEVDHFLKEVGAEGVEPIDKLKITPGESSEGTKTVVLKLS